MYTFLKSTHRDKFNGIYHCRPIEGKGRNKVIKVSYILPFSYQLCLIVHLFLDLREDRFVCILINADYPEWGLPAPIGQVFGPGLDCPRKDSQHPPGFNGSPFRRQSALGPKTWQLGAGSSHSGIIRIGQDTHKAMLYTQTITNEV